MSAPGNFDSKKEEFASATGIEAGIALALGERRDDGEGSLVFNALFVDSGENSWKRFSFVWPYLSSSCRTAGGTWGTTFEELAIVASAGRARYSRVSSFGKELVVVCIGIGLWPTVS